MSISESLPPLLLLNSTLPVSSVADWEIRRGELLDQLTHEIYGEPLSISPLEFVSSSSFTDVEKGLLISTLTYQFSQIPGSPKIEITEVSPIGQVVQNALIVIDGCKVDHAPSARSSNQRGGFFTSCSNVINDYQSGIDKGAKRGLAFIFVPTIDIFPDNDKTYVLKLAPWLSSLSSKPPGALMAWASIVRSVHALWKAQKPWQKFWVMGFSRYGKAAALSMAIDPTMDGAVLHMSGSLGSTLSRGNTHETLESIAENYPHWVNAYFRDHTDPEKLSTDQHALLALAAPRPLLVEDGILDVWSNEPLSAQAAREASTVWEKIFNLPTILEVKTSDVDPIFRPEQKLVHKNFTQIHSLMAGDWDFILNFILTDR